METNSNTEKTTATQVADAVAKTEKEYEYNLQAPLFIKFAEYLGYVSEVLPWCDEWCEGKEPEAWKRKFIEIDARQMYTEMVNDLGTEKIKEYYESFYEAILFEWDETLVELDKKKGGN